MDKSMTHVTGFFDLRKTLMLIIIVLGLTLLNTKWLTSLNFDLAQKSRELSESRILLESKSEFQGYEKELESFAAFTKSEASGSQWADVIPGLVADHRLILRQIRPGSGQRKGQFEQEELLVQVDGSIQSFLGFLHALTALERPIYVSRYVVTARSVGTGFISAEMTVVYLNTRK